MTVASPPALRVARLHPDAILPTRARRGDAGLDLHALAGASFTGRPGERLEVDTGIAVEIPDGWVGLVCPRSGLAARHGIGLTNAPGVIDSGYRGSVRVLLTTTDATFLEVASGDRIAQLLVVPAFDGAVEEVESLDGSTDRGTAGFGSTGGFG